MQFELLNQRHAVQLLDFEIKNRAFFESLIAPRGDNFYSPAGIQAHIDALANEPTSLAYVLTDNASIIARANIKNIADKRCAEIGYRVGEAAIGRGVGSTCVTHLVQQAHSLQLTSLVAYVMDNNPASQSVLVKNGFQLALCLPRALSHQGIFLHGFEYRRSLR